MALPDTTALWRPEDYLALDRRAETKSEFLDGAIVAMTGGSAEHSRIKFDLARSIGNRLAGGPGEGYDSDRAFGSTPCAMPTRT
jgi:Uma2 family endonuclease